MPRERSYTALRLDLRIDHGCVERNAQVDYSPTERGLRDCVRRVKDVILGVNHNLGGQNVASTQDACCALCQNSLGDEFGSLVPARS